MTTQPNNHYEQAFQAYLDSREQPYVTISQARKAIIHGTAQKSFDFIVHKPNGTAMLIDIKGRKLKFSYFKNDRPGQNWVTSDDVDSMLKWQAHFGETHFPLFIFAYWIFDIHSPYYFSLTRRTLPDPPRNTPRSSTHPPFAAVPRRFKRQRFALPSPLRLPPHYRLITPLSVPAACKQIVNPQPPSSDSCFMHNSRLYWFVAINVSDYQALMTTRSPKWHTVNLPAHKFRLLCKPFHHFLS